MASLSDVAKEAGVSLTTASLVLNRPRQPNRVSEACAQRVRNVADKLGYIPNYHARSMKLGKAETIAVAIDVSGGNGNGDATVSELADGYFSHLIGGIELHLRNVGYELLLIGPDHNARAPERGLQGLRQRRFDGMIVLGVVIDPSHPNLLADSPADAPIVAIEYTGETDLPVVDYDERYGVELAVRHLAELKHKRLLWVGHNAQRGSLGGGDRQAIFEQTARRLALRFSACGYDFHPEPGRTARALHVEQAHACMRDYLADKGSDFTGIVAYNDPVAVGVCAALAQADLHVPRDVSVVGFDDVEASFCVPRLTSVSHKLTEMGKRAAEMVMEMVNDEAARERLRGRREVLRPELVVRESTAEARAV
ncbi:MAG TPA: LacI family DNA-binding transcriptional regulator [Tepidisphaeraceae bacterium]|jgi:DNA-binding LacI/PurR family transcriptional regulator